jgi:hypothetical protein
MIHVTFLEMLFLLEESILLRVTPKNNTIYLFLLSEIEARPSK